MHYYLKWVLQCDSAYAMLGKDLGTLGGFSWSPLSTWQMFQNFILWVSRVPRYIWNGGWETKDLRNASSVEYTGIHESNLREHVPRKAAAWLYLRQRQSLAGKTLSRESKRIPRHFGVFPPIICLKTTQAMIEVELCLVDLRLLQTVAI